MCGELEEEDGQTQFERALFARFKNHARTLIDGHKADDKTPDDKASDDKASGDLHGYMDRLFSDALSRALRDGEAGGEEKQYERLAAQPLVFARLAGFLAAHVSLHEDPLRKVMEALMTGYAEAESIAPAHGHDHDHGHDHGQDHGHHH